jgi:pantothenate kinase
MVAFVRISGGGKSASSFLVAHLLEELGIESMIMPPDRYHYPLEHLKMFPNPEDAIYRQGAPDTFEPHELQRDLERIRTGEEEVVTVPGFDHMQQRRSRARCSYVRPKTSQSGVVQKTGEQLTII